MNNYCRNCGQKLENNVTNCPNCNAEIFEKRINVDEKKEEITKFKEKEKNYVIIILLLQFIPYLLVGSENAIVTFISPLLSVASYILLIYARITMSNSKVIKTMFNILLILFIIRLLYVIIIFVACTNIIKGCY